MRERWGSCSTAAPSHNDRSFRQPAEHSMSVDVEAIPLLFGENGSNRTRSNGALTTAALRSTRDFKTFEPVGAAANIWATTNKIMKAKQIVDALVDCGMFGNQEAISSQTRV